MDAFTEKYRKLNPFVQNSVGESVIWGSDDNDFCDVESINKAAFEAILSDIRSVGDDHKTRARFLVGAAGSGKSHLFARLRRKLSDGQFTFVSNPPTAPLHIKRFVLRKVLSGMTKSVMSPHGPLPYSQVQRMVYGLMQRVLRGKGLKIGQIHERWKKLSRAKCDQNMRKLEGALGKIPGLDIPIDVRRVLVRILDDEKRDLAVAWLSGNQNLGEADYLSLKAAGPLADEGISELMKQLGHLSIGAGPIILILDQLDTLVKPDQIHELESLMIDLNDSSRNWYVIVSLVQEKFDLWHSMVSMPFKHRFGTVTHDSIDLTTAELSPLSPEEREQLIIARLGTPALRYQRSSDQIDDPCYPLSELIVQQLTCSDISNARMLIQKASEAYVGAVSGGTEPTTTRLCDFIEQLLADLRAELQEEDYAVDTSCIADRIDEMFSLLCNVKSRSVLQRTDGPLHAEIANFEGVDRIYNHDGTTVRVVCYDVQQKNKFPSVLKRIVDAPRNTILIRDGRISVSGKVTKERLTAFQKDNRFFHLSLDQIKDLHSLGILLAKMREGEFENEDTEPIPTEGSISECLAQHPTLIDTDLVQAFLAMVGLEKGVTGTGPPPIQKGTLGGSGVSPPGDPVVTEITALMATERWMSFERLCVRVNARGVNADPQQVYQRLKEKPICDSILIYPRHVDLLEGIGIVIWATEE